MSNIWIVLFIFVGGMLCGYIINEHVSWRMLDNTIAEIELLGESVRAEIKSLEERPQGEWVEEIIEELESRKDYGAEYAQAMEDVIVILKAKFDIDKGAESDDS